ncbi:MAG TPA: M35 family metallo-endopeptidase [Roseomonas sp.]|jgi:hypothetical protein
MRLLRTALAFLLSSSLSACAAVSSDDVILAASPDAVARAIATPGPECSREQAAMVNEARTTARNRIREGIRFLQREPESPHVRLWFGDAPAKMMLQVLTNTLNRMERRDSYVMHCNDMKTCGRGQMGYMRPGLNIVGVCQPFFRAGLDGQDSRYGILVHEFSHLGGRTSDYVYQPRAARMLAKSDWLRAASNADNYEYFIENLPR